MPRKENMAQVVVALAAQRLANDRIVQIVDPIATEKLAVLAPVATIPAVAGSGSPDRVNGAKARGGERHEQLRVISHSARDTVMATVEARVNELPNVAGIQVRT